MKICVICNLEKIETEFPFRNKNRGTLRAECKNCAAIYNKKYKTDNQEYIRTREAEFYQANKIEVSARQQEHYIKNKTIILTQKSIYYYNTIEDRRQYEFSRQDKQSANARERRKNNIEIRLRSNFSARINIALKKNNSSKLNESISNFVPYSFQELKLHLESLFDYWMNWDNYGKYIAKTWNDNDSSTWIWNIDHIIPQSDLPFSDMKEENFKKCWALENLRPYSAKLNNKDRNRRR